MRDLAAIYKEFEALRRELVALKGYTNTLLES
jgi:hypothetical protein